jgi:ipoprotein LpqH
MHERFALAAILVMVGVAGCSSSTPSTPEVPNGAVPAGTAQISIGGQDGQTEREVACQTNQTLTSIKIGSDSEDVTILVDNSEGLTAQGVAITNMGGFTGSYWRDQQGSARTSMVGQTYIISGSADGFGTDEPGARTSRDFTIRAAC